MGPEMNLVYVEIIRMMYSNEHNSYIQVIVTYSVLFEKMGSTTSRLSIRLKQSTKN